MRPVCPGVQHPHVTLMWGPRAFWACGSRCRAPCPRAATGRGVIAQCGARRGAWRGAWRDGTGGDQTRVLNSELRVPLAPELHSFSRLTPAPNATFDAWKALHTDCSPTLWVHVADTLRLRGPHPYRHMSPELLKHTPRPDAKNAHKFEMVKTSAVMTLHLRHHHQRSGG